MFIIVSAICCFLYNLILQTSWYTRFVPNLCAIGVAFHLWKHLHHAENLVCLKTDWKTWTIYRDHYIFPLKKKTRYQNQNSVCTLNQIYFMKCSHMPRLFRCIMMWLRISSSHINLYHSDNSDNFFS